MSTTPFTFDVEKHEYFVGGNRVPGCTSVLASGGLVPFSMVSLDILERKSELGRQVHKACHLDNIGRLGSFDKVVAPFLESWRYYKRHAKNFQLLLSEFQCIGYVNGMAFGMQIDTNAMVDDYDTVIELKVGEVYPHHGVQLAAQAAGLPHPKINAPFARFLQRKRIVVQLRDTGIPKVHDEFTAKSDYETFGALLYIANWKKRHYKVYEKEKAF